MSSTRIFRLFSNSGNVYVGLEKRYTPRPRWSFVRLHSLPSQKVPVPLSAWEGSIGANQGFLVVPHWLPASMLVTFAALPWIRWRFSLRTLLIGMAAVAAVLGLIVWAAK
jgi:hypothetical protein